MDTLAILCFASAAFLVALVVLDSIVPDIRVNRVGGLLHWRCGRLGGSFYVAKAR